MQQPDAIPLSEFRTHAVDLVDHVRATGRPIVLTQKGKPSAVVLGVEEYEELLFRLGRLHDARRAGEQAARSKTSEQCGAAFQQLARAKA